MSKTLAFILFALSFLTACKNDKKALVDPVFADSLITHFTPPASLMARNKEMEMQFWKKQNRSKKSRDGE